MITTHDQDRTLGDIFARDDVMSLDVHIDARGNALAIDDDGRHWHVFTDGECPELSEQEVVMTVVLPQGDALTRISSCTGCDQQIGNEAFCEVRWPMARVYFHLRCVRKGDEVLRTVSARNEQETS